MLASSGELPVARSVPAVTVQVRGFGCTTSTWTACQGAPAFHATSRPRRKAVTGCSSDTSCPQISAATGTSRRRPRANRRVARPCHPEIVAVDADHRADLFAHHHRDGLRPLQGRVLEDHVAVRVHHSVEARPVAEQDVRHDRVGTERRPARVDDEFPLDGVVRAGGRTTGGQRERGENQQSERPARARGRRNSAKGLGRRVLFPRNPSSEFPFKDFGACAPTPRRTSPRRSPYRPGRTPGRTARR